MDLEQFISTWGIDGDAQAALMQLEPGPLERILTSFAPKPGTRDVNRLLHGFIKSVSGGGNGGREGRAAGRSLDVVAAQHAAAAAQAEARRAAAAAADAAAEAAAAEAQAFAMQWDLDESAESALLQLPKHLQDRLMKEFQPRPGTRDVNRLFHGFVRSVQAGLPQAAAHRGGAAAALAAPPKPAAGPRVIPARGGFNARSGFSSIPKRPPAPPRPPMGQPQLSYGDLASLQAWVAQWGLDDSAHHSLLQLEPAMQARVMQEFVPKPGTRDVNRLFHGFMRSVNDPASSRTRAVGRIVPPPGRSKVEVPADGSLQSFCDTWGLDESCLSALSQLDPQVQLQVLQDFAPKAQTQDVSRLFHGFLRSVQSRASVQPRASNGKGRAVSALITDSFAAAGGYVIAGKHAAFTGEVPSAEEVDTFMQAWELDESCSSSFQSQSPEVQRRVLDHFRPRPGTRDVRSLFHGFIRSVADGGGKRPKLADGVPSSQWDGTTDSLEF